MSKQKRVVVGMSGGVDSSVAAYLLKEKGYDVIGLFIKSWRDDESTGECTSADDFRYMRRVARQLQIPYYTINFEEEYEEKVFQHFLAEYRAGRTPNPDILCNREIKFGHFLQTALGLQADYIATGHYARLVDGHLAKAVDKNKDQTYFLYAVNKKEWSKTLFPLGELTKPEVRAIASKLNLASANKKDSTGICFVENKELRQFLQRYIPAKPGEIRSVAGEVLGEHQGVWYYTIGQRQGLGIGGTQDGSSDPWFVVGKDIEQNILLVDQGHNNPLLFTDQLVATELNWLTDNIGQEPFSCHAKCRYRQKDQEVHVTPGENGTVQVTFAEDQRAVTPGQSIVFYQGDICLGGGIIDKVSNEVKPAQVDQTIQV